MAKIVKNEDKLDKLARMVAKGFDNVESRFDNVESRFNNVESRIMKIESSMATKNDLATLRNDVDIMLDRHIGTFRKDYNELAA